MGVSSTANRVLLAGDGASVTFVFPYYFFNQTDLQVWVYDTVGGGTVQQVLNTNYAISGTPNLQGLYQNGANVVFSVAPPVTSIVVIFRNPPQVSNYALGQNGNISSAAIVQQFDYLTLLTQRLQDQISRCIMVSDGAGTAFSNRLPPNIALVPGQSPVINQQGNGWSLGGAPGSGSFFTWQNVVIPFTAFQGAALSEATNLFQLPPGYILRSLIVKHAQAFVGAGISDVTMSVGTVSTPGQFSLAFDIAQAVADQSFDFEEPNYLASFANVIQVIATATAVGANLSNLTQGSVTVWYLLENINA